MRGKREEVTEVMMKDNGRNDSWHYNYSNSTNDDMSTVATIIVIRIINNYDDHVSIITIEK